MIAVKRAFLIMLTAAFIAAGQTAYAGYPMITDLSNQVINIGEATPVMRFKVTDDKTPAWDLAVSYRSSNRALVPQTDDNIILGGSGSERTVQVTPTPDKAGIAIITIIVTDTDGGSDMDTFQVEVINPPK